MIGTIEDTTWRTVAADLNGVPQPEKVGTCTRQLRAYFAYKVEAQAWLAEQQADGYEGTIGMAAISYFGPTDSPSNCWFVQVERELHQTFAEHTAAMLAAVTPTGTGWPGPPGCEPDDAEAQRIAEEYQDASAELARIEAEEAHDAAGEAWYLGAYGEGGTS